MKLKQDSQSEVTLLVPNKVTKSYVIVLLTSMAGIAIPHGGLTPFILSEYFTVNGQIDQSAKFGEAGTFQAVEDWKWLGTHTHTSPG